ncbi:Permease of the drug/metabolite transporter (DMT) superfamily [Octadecabacter temperatus]|uniref:Putative DMT superfamily transporter inner membrane protein n=1 Tax=Octadecabacter temperatus TaxID=1458307 RepID=A0A0K0Y3T1_9RHOB|nr:DMT family transporter [Octadecabacter temperatus]AKS45532.1 putative DMT superfamily transporter inner membrane protein [Octadecabacter temperatus]SIN95048.1 Permease of the drug/metabolite transporter (DMT) superfamily [Octadecabacter temperatus]
MTTHPTPLNWFSIGLLGLIWGGTFMVVSIALEGYGPLTVACARTTLGAVTLLLLVLAMGRPLPKQPVVWVYLAVTGVMNTALPFALLSWGQQYVPSAFAGISMAALPLFVLPLAHIFADDKLSPRKAAGVVIGFVGAVVLIGPTAFDFSEGSLALPQLACVAASLSYAISSVLTRRCPPVDSVVMAALTLVVGAICLIPAMLMVEGVPTWVEGRAGYAILFLGFVPTAFAALLRVTTIRTAGPVFMTLVNYQVPVWSMIFGAWVLSEVLPLRFFAALALILFGLGISQGPSLMRVFKR